MRLVENWFSENPLLFLFSVIKKYSQFFSSSYFSSLAAAVPCILHVSPVGELLGSEKMNPGRRMKDVRIILSVLKLDMQLYYSTRNRRRHRMATSLTLLRGVK
jgi:hypothetical protein